MITFNDGQQYTAQSSGIVIIKKSINIRGYKINIDVPYELKCDFTNIPPKDHITVLQTLMTIN